MVRISKNETIGIKLNTDDHGVVEEILSEEITQIWNNDFYYEYYLDLVKDPDEKDNMLSDYFSKVTQKSKIPVSSKIYQSLGKCL